MKAKDLLLEVTSDDIGVYRPEEDALGRMELGDTRKPRITLRDVRKMKRIRATRKVAQLKKENLFGVMYGEPAGGDEGGSPF